MPDHTPPPSSPSIGKSSNHQSLRPHVQRSTSSFTGEPHIGQPSSRTPIPSASLSAPRGDAVNHRLAASSTAQSSARSNGMFAAVPRKFSAQAGTQDVARKCHRLGTARKMSVPFDLHGPRSAMPSLPTNVDTSSARSQPGGPTAQDPNQPRNVGGPSKRRKKPTGPFLSVNRPVPAKTKTDIALRFKIADELRQMRSTTADTIAQYAMTVIPPPVNPLSAQRLQDVAAMAVIFDDWVQQQTGSQIDIDGVTVTAAADFIHLAKPPVSHLARFMGYWAKTTVGREGDTLKYGTLQRGHYTIQTMWRINAKKPFDNVTGEQLAASVVSLLHNMKLKVTPKLAPPILGSTILLLIDLFFDPRWKQRLISRLTSATWTSLAAYTGIRAGAALRTSNTTLKQIKLPSKAKKLGAVFADFDICFLPPKDGQQSNRLAGFFRKHTDKAAVGIGRPIPLNEGPTCGTTPIFLLLCSLMMGGFVSMANIEFWLDPATLPKGQRCVLTLGETAQKALAFPATKNRQYSATSANINVALEAAGRLGGMRRPPRTRSFRHAAQQALDKEGYESMLKKNTMHHSLQSSAGYNHYSARMIMENVGNDDPNQHARSLEAFCDDGQFDCNAPYELDEQQEASLDRDDKVQEQLDRLAATERTLQQSRSSANLQARNLAAYLVEMARKSARHRKIGELRTEYFAKIQTDTGIRRKNVENSPPQDDIASPQTVKQALLNFKLALSKPPSRSLEAFKAFQIVLNMDGKRPSRRKQSPRSADELDDIAGSDLSDADPASHSASPGKQESQEDTDQLDGQDEDNDADENWLDEDDGVDDQDDDHDDVDSLDALHQAISTGLSSTDEQVGNDDEFYYRDDDVVGAVDWSR